MAIIDFWTTNLNPLILEDSEGHLIEKPKKRYTKIISSNIDITQKIDYKIISAIESKQGISFILKNTLE